MNRLALLGASGHGKVVADTAMASGWRSVTFYDDAWPKKTQADPWSVSGDSNALLRELREFDGMVVTIGNCATRWKRHSELEDAGGLLVTVVHPRAYLSPRAQVGRGSVAMAGAVVNAGAVIGAASIINTGATVDHDCLIADGVHLSPGVHLSGNVSIGSCSWIGVGSCVREGIKIGTGVVVGAGSVVIRDVADGLTVVGNPAAPLARTRS